MSSSSTNEEKKNDSTSDRQHVWIIRYGLTEFSLVEGVGPYDSDIHPTEGVAHAQAIANRLNNNNNNTPDKKPNIVYADPFLRCAHTAHIIASTLNTPLRIEEGLTEWQTPSLLVDPNGVMTYPRSALELKEKFDTVDVQYKSVNPFVSSKEEKDDDDDVVGAPKFEESVQDLKVRCSATMSKILSSHLSDANNIAIVSHAPCNQMLAFDLAGKSSNKEDGAGIGPWSLGGITCFSRSVVEQKEKENLYGEWTLDYFSDTSHMPGEYKEGLKGRWSLPDFQ